MATTPTTQTRNPLAGDSAEGIIRGMVETIVREARPRALAVILFGSRAHGDHRPTSDVDLLVVLPEGVDTRHVRADLYNRLSGAGLPKDILAATPARLAAARGDYTSVLHWAQERGVTLYQAEGRAEAAETTEPPAAAAAPGALV
jgi:predicted nucleotidyltransferase